jgi:hypothetical protein
LPVAGSIIEIGVSRSTGTWSGVSLMVVGSGSPIGVGLNQAARAVNRLELDVTVDRISDAQLDRRLRARRRPGIDRKLRQYRDGRGEQEESEQKTADRLHMDLPRWTCSRRILRRGR